MNSWLQGRNIVVGVRSKIEEFMAVRKQSKRTISERMGKNYLHYPKSSLHDPPRYTQACALLTPTDSYFNIVDISGLMITIM